MRDWGWWWCAAALLGSHDLLLLLVEKEKEGWGEKGWDGVVQERNV